MFRILNEDEVLRALGFCGLMFGFVLWFLVEGLFGFYDSTIGLLGTE